MNHTSILTHTGGVGVGWYAENWASSTYSFVTHTSLKTRRHENRINCRRDDITIVFGYVQTDAGGEVKVLCWLREIILSEKFYIDVST